jgi:hypothetical protein
MRTKSLFLSAAVIAAGLVSASAQVYSVNVVGYANVVLTNGFNMIANPLDKSGTGQNTISNVFGTNLPNNSIVYKFVNGTYVSAIYALAGKGATTPTWDANGVVQSLNPGEGVFVKVAAPVTNTFVGTVLQGSLNNTNIPAGGGFSILASQVPQGGGLQTVLGYPARNGDIVYTWNPAGSGSYVPYVYAPAGKGSTNPVWSPSEPSIAVGQGFFLKTTAGQTWSRNFTVQ